MTSWWQRLIGSQNRSEPEERSVADAERAALPNSLSCGSPSPSRSEVPPAFRDVLAGFQIVSALDCSVCLKCSALDGRRFRADSGPRPPFHKGCRCVAIPIARSWRELGIDVDEWPVGERASPAGPVPANWHHLRWLLTTQPRWRIEQCLGHSHSALLLRGEIDPEDFRAAVLTPRYRVRTIHEMIELFPQAAERAGLRGILLPPQS